MFRLPVCPHCHTVYHYGEVSRMIFFHPTREQKCYHCKKSMKPLLRGLIVLAAIYLAVSFGSTVAIINIFPNATALTVFIVNALWAVLPSCGLSHTVTELSGLSTVPFSPVPSIYVQAASAAPIYAYTGSDIAPSNTTVINVLNIAFFNAPILIRLFAMIIPFYSWYAGSSGQWFARPNFHQYYLAGVQESFSQFPSFRSACCKFFPLTGPR